MAYDQVTVTFGQIMPVLAKLYDSGRYSQQAVLTDDGQAINEGELKALTRRTLSRVLDLPLEPILKDMEGRGLICVDRKIYRHPTTRAPVNLYRISRDGYLYLCGAHGMLPSRDEK